mmetsp:Transcript_5627/g.19276  ORF Transcript_5627/g.19276 Transcript_5627/m.19276 type:complete len:359 (+) Transcript_5627:145-1221(+)
MHASMRSSVQLSKLTPASSLKRAFHSARILAAPRHAASGGGDEPSTIDVDASVSSADAGDVSVAVATEPKEAEADAWTPTPPEGWVAPEPKRFTPAEGQIGDLATASAPFLLRLGTGALARGYSVSIERDEDASAYSVARGAGWRVTETSTVAELPRPEQPIELFEFQGCPFCRKVREAVCILDLDVMFYPTPKDGPTFRPQAIAEGGKSMFPYMRDPNTGVSMYESDDIIAYLFKTYGDGQVPLALTLGPLTVLTEGLSLMPRMGKGSKYVPAKMPKEPLVVWSYEPSPFCVVVEEVLCELELPHLKKTTPRGSPKRQELLEKVGHFQVPYLEDPNTGIAMFESAAIVDYLRKTYAA